MKKSILSVVFVAVATVIAVIAFRHNSYPYETVAGDPYQTRIYKLRNGLTVFLSRNEEKPEIQTMIAVRAGAEDDPLESTGLAHYQEHLMFKGTSRIGTVNYDKEKPYLDAIDSLYEVYRVTEDSFERRQIYHTIDSISYEGSQYIVANEYDKLMSMIGATGLNAYTASDRTCYHSVIPANELARWLEIEYERMSNEVIRGFHTELETVYEEYNRASTQDWRNVYMAINNLLYPNLPYRQHTVLGTPEDLKSPSLRNIKKFYKTFYRPNNVAICLSGDLDYDKTIALIDKHFGQWQEGDIPARKVYPDYQLNTVADTIVYGQEADNLWIAWKLPAVGNEDVDILEMMDHILNNGRCGLFDLDLIQRQKVLSASSSLWTGNDYSTFFLIGEPKLNQSEDELKDLLLSEIEKLKRGEFDENLLTAVINNFRKNEMRSMSSNRNRTDIYSEAFINKLPYKFYVDQLDRLSKVTKADIVRIANTYFTDKYVLVRKRKTNKMNATPIAKPAITPIQMNRDTLSRFMQMMSQKKTESIQPQFLDFEHDLSKTTLDKGQQLLYVQNKENDIFDLRFVIKMGSNDNLYLALVPSFMHYLGTGSLTVEQLKTQLYTLATDVSINVYGEEIRIGMNGLQSNFEPSLRLLEDWIMGALSDESKYKEVVKDIIKSHEDAKTVQQSCFSYLAGAGIMGLEYRQQHTLTPYMMRQMTGEKLLEQVRRLLPQICSVLYYGPATLDEMTATLNKSSKLVAQGDVSSRQQATKVDGQIITEPEVWIAPFNAPNIYMMGYANRGTIYDPKQEAVVQLFNAYFGDGMDGIVFQEMREARALAYASWAGYSLASQKDKTNDFSTYIVSQNDKLRDCVQTFDSICNQLPLSQTAFDNAKTSLLKRIEKRRVSRGSIIGTYLSYTEKGWQKDYNEDIYRAVKALTLDDVVKFQEENIKNSTYRYLILGDERRLDRQFIQSLGKVKRLSLVDIFGY